MRQTATVDKLLEFAAGEPRDINKRAERARGKQTLTRSPQNPGGGLLLLAEPTHERGLPDAGLAPDQYETPITAAHCRRKQIAQSDKLIIALEQLRRRRAPDGP
jgi:hypothetical protein